MKQISSEKYNVAWFKLAEFVSRGEKERALAMYRLLAHSLEDQAFARQLEADLLLSFNDGGAFERYCQAAKLYAHHGRITEAAAVYEHIITLEPRRDNELQQLVELYKEMPKHVRIFESTQHMLRVLMQHNEFEKVSQVLQLLDDPTRFAVVQQELVQAWLKIENPPTDSLMVHIKKIIDYYFSAKQPKLLQTFLMTLKLLHALLYQKACNYMQDTSFNEL